MKKKTAETETVKSFEGQCFFTLDHQFIIRNSAICKKCKEHIQSTWVHDFVTCKCKSISVDGGTDYLRRLGELKSMTDTSISKSIKELLAEERLKARLECLSLPQTSASKPTSSVGRQKSCKKASPSKGVKRQSSR